MILNLTEQTFMRMKSVVLDEDENEAFRLLKEFIKQLENQKNAGMKSHLDK